MKGNMDRDVLQVLEEPYHRQGFLGLVQSLFGSNCCFDVPKQYDIPKRYAPYMQECMVYGSYDDGSHHVLILEIVVPTQKSMWEKEAQQRSFVQRVLQEEHVECCAAVVSFVPQDAVCWYFSLLTNPFDESEEVCEAISCLRRYSFVVGPGSYPLQRRIQDVLSSRHPPTWQSIRDMFHVESYIQDFCTEYRRLFYWLRNILVAQSITDDVTYLAKSILQRFLVLQFLQKNGSLGIPVAGTEQIRVRFLEGLFTTDQEERPQDGDYFQKIVLPIWDAICGTQNPMGIYEIQGKQYRTSFVNPYLAMPMEECLKSVHIPNLFFNHHDGLWGIWGRYSFDMVERMPWDRVVGIDPEILGTTFEYLLDENDSDEPVRERRGVFYTPRFVVHHMCQTALKQYLYEQSKNTPAKDVLERFHWTTDNVGEEDLFFAYAEEWDGFLHHVQMCDPAVGSGAFAMGMLQEILRMRRLFPSNTQEDTFLWKKRAIMHSIHGVDIDADAIAITRLRMCFSLFVDTDELPEDVLSVLAQRFVQGDSVQGRTYQERGHIQKPHGLYWSQVFTDVWVQKGGFDIIIGNPPYGASIDASDKQLEEYLGTVPDKEMYYYFIQLAKHLVHSTGLLSYIIPNTWMTNTYASTYRKDLLNNWDVIEVIDCARCTIFGSATVFNSIIVFQKGTTEVLGYKESDQQNLFRLLAQPRKYIPKDVLLQNEDWSVLFSHKYEHYKRIQRLCAAPDIVGLRTYAQVKQGMKPYDFAVRRDHCPDAQTWEQISVAGKEKKIKYRQKKETISNRVFHSHESRGLSEKWLKGVDITPFSISWETRTKGDRYVHYGDWLATPFTRAVFEEERILIREIISPSIYATITDKAYFHDPGVISIKNKEGRDLLYVLLGILNSTLGNFILFNASMKTNKQRFPKILIKVLQDFPVPVSIETKNPTTEALKVCVQKRLQDPSLSQKGAEEYSDDALDTLVFRLYTCTKEDREHMQGWKH